MYDFLASYWPFILMALLIFMAISLRKKNTFFYWAARGVAILDIIFLVWMSLEEGGYTLSNFLMQNALTSIPLLVILIAAWKYDLIASIGFFAAGIFFLLYFDWGDFPIGLVPIFTGALFFINWLKRNP